MALINFLFITDRKWQKICIAAAFIIFLSNGIGAALLGAFLVYVSFYIQNAVLFWNYLSNTPAQELFLKACEHLGKHSKTGNTEDFKIGICLLQEAKTKGHQGATALLNLHGR